MSESVATETRPAPRLSPVPVVVDADLLIRNIGYGVREGTDESLITNARPGYARAGGIPLYATTAVAAEVERHLHEVARRCERPEQEVIAVWNDVFRPRIVFVPVRGDELDDPRIAAVRRLHEKDAPTAALAVLLGESVLLTHNVKHFRPLGIAGQDVTEMSIEAHRLGSALKQADAATVLPRVVGYGAYAGTQRLVAAVGSEGVLAFALLGLGLIVKYWETDRIRSVRAGAVRVMQEIGPPLGEFLERAERASATLWQFAVAPMEPRPAMSCIARALAAEATLSTEEIADRLRWDGFGFNGGVHRTQTRAWLLREQCFHEVRRGHWSLGYVIRPLCH